MLVAEAEGLERFLRDEHIGVGARQMLRHLREFARRNVAGDESRRAEVLVDDAPPRGILEVPVGNEDDVDSSLA